jgi:calcium/proton exchanger cax
MRSIEVMRILERLRSALEASKYMGERARHPRLHSLASVLVQIFDISTLKSLLKPSLNWLLVFVPVAVVLRVWPQLGNETALFICSCFAVVPLAGWMGRATEELAEHLGHGIGGLLNATFGNAAELIIALVALSKGLTGVVKASITGSIIGNVLLVMGFSIVGGGVKFREQRFNKTAARASATALTLAAVALTVPTIFHVTAAGRSGGWSQATEQKLSLAIAVVLFVTYACVLGFELITHKQLYAGDSQDGGEDRKEGTRNRTKEGLSFLRIKVNPVPETNDSRNSTGRILKVLAGDRRTV